jgi:predicted esterase
VKPLPGPESNAIFVLLIAAFFLLIWWLRSAKRIVVQIVAACVAFLPAMLFGFATVNRYYGYYQTWGAISADFGGTGNLAPLPNLGPSSSAKLDTILGRIVDLRTARAQGVTVRLPVPGVRSGIARQVLIFLPPQYFQAAYASYRFPVIELMHGWPGRPQDWVNVLHVPAVMNSLVAAHLARPAVLVMPDVNGAPRLWSEQCLNQVGGQQDATYLALDVPAYVAGRLRVQPPGPAWGISGYSEGGFCTANLALRYPSRYGYAGVMSGYFTPLNYNLNAGRLVPPFRGIVSLWLHNNPMWLVRNWTPFVRLPNFWLSAARDDRVAYKALASFGLLLRQHQPAVPVFIVGSGGHTARTWRAATPRMLMWMTPQLASVTAPAQLNPALPRPGPPSELARPSSLGTR